MIAFAKNTKNKAAVDTAAATLEQMKNLNGN
jgi:hypothetical protein